MLSQAAKDALLQEINDKINQNGVRSITGAKLNEVLLAIATSVDDLSLLIPRLHISSTVKKTEVNNDITYGFDTLIMAKPSTDVAFLEGLNPEIWLFRKGRTGVSGDAAFSGKKRSKWVHCTDRDANRPSTDWPYYSNDSKGVGSNDPINNPAADSNPRFGALKTEWALPLDSFEAGKSVAFTLEAENYFGINPNNGLLTGNLSKSYLDGENKRIVASYRGAKPREGKLVFNVYSPAVDEYKLDAMRDFSNSYEMALAIVVDHPSKPFTKVIGQMTRFNYKHIFTASGDTAFRIKLH